MKQTYKKMKNLARIALASYVIVGSVYMMDEKITKDLTGHYSVDIYTKKIQPSKIEKKVLNCLFGCEFK